MYRPLSPLSSLTFDEQHKVAQNGKAVAGQRAGQRESHEDGQEENEDGSGEEVWARLHIGPEYGAPEEQQSSRAAEQQSGVKHSAGGGVTAISF